MSVYWLLLLLYCLGETNKKVSSSRIQLIFNIWNMLFILHMFIFLKTFQWNVFQIYPLHSNCVFHMIIFLFLPTFPVEIIMSILSYVFFLNLILLLIFLINATSIFLKHDVQHFWMNSKYSIGAKLITSKYYWFHNINT